MKTILEICREAADLAGVTRPTDLFSPMDYEWLDLIRDELGYLRKYGEWRETVQQAYFTVEEHKKRYLFEDIAPDFMCLSNNTIFIKDKQERVIAAIVPEKHIENDYFRIKDDCLIIKNKKLAGSKILLQYRSTCVAWDYDDFEEKTVLDKNTDVPIFDEYLVKLGVLWRYERYKGVDYGETLSEYTRELKKRFTMN